MLIYILIFTCISQTTLCDLPVHCFPNQIAGVWNFYLTEPLLHGMGQLSCGHEIPDAETSSYQAGWSQEFRRHMQLNLTLGYQVYEAQSRLIIAHTGNWTMIYDEGFEIYRNNLTLFTFSKYTMENGEYVSYCSETLVGWYNDHQRRQRGCFRGVKMGHSKRTPASQNAHVVQPEVLDQQWESNAQKVPLNEKGQIDHESITNKINDNENKQWKAKNYEQYQGLSFQEMNQLAGRSKFNGLGSAKSFIEQNNYRNFSLYDVSDLPTEYNLQRYMPNVRNQRSCGSCYTISTMAMLSARLRMQGHQVDLAPQLSLDCNYYNQGCNGGYPFLVAKWAYENYLVTEEEYHYTATTSENNCQYNSSQPAYKVHSYGLIGGHYGSSNERNIMQEILNHGPVVMNFEPTFDFIMDPRGQFKTCVGIQDYCIQLPKKQKVDHSVVCYGWGEENGEKYWLLQNSWGIGWGEQGRFRMRRGTDESAIESMAEMAVPQVVHRHNRQSFSQVNDLSHQSFI